MSTWQGIADVVTLYTGVRSGELIFLLISIQVVYRSALAVQMALSELRISIKFTPAQAFPPLATLLAFSPQHPHITKLTQPTGKQCVS